MVDHEGGWPRQASPAQNSLSDPSGLKEGTAGAPAGVMTSAAPAVNMSKISLFPRLASGSAFCRGAHQASLMSGFGV